MINVNYPIPLTGSVETKAIALNGTLNTSAFTINGNLQCNAVQRTLPEYAGPYEVTPSLTPTTLNTSNMVLTQNITIAKIPGTMENNYGRITWDGSKLRVS